MGYRDYIYRSGITFFMMIMILIAFTGCLSAWNNTEIKWKTIETEHFAVHFHSGEEWSAREAARIAEEVYGPLTGFYGFYPGKVHINIHDKRDRSSGATYYYLNRIDIDASDFDFNLRGTADWLRNVITHEFTHMVTIQAAMKMPRWMPAIYLQGITFEKEKRPDVITGYPNFQGSLPVAGEVVPNWFAEGVAQFQCPTARNDIWDSHRDMLLRTAVLNGTLLTLDQMGVFGKNSLGAEMVYNQGYSIVRYIHEKYGAGKLATLLKEHSGFFRISFNGACRKVLGISDDQLYRQWLSHLEDEYRLVRDRVSKRVVDGDRVAGRGFINMFPFFTAEYGGFCYLSNMGRDYMAVDLVHSPGGGKPEILVKDLSSRAALSPDGKVICYSRRTGDNRFGYELNDIYLFNIDSRKEIRLTRSSRVVDAVFSPDSRFLAAVSCRDGSEYIVLVDAGNGMIRRLTERKTCRYYRLSWGTKGILATRFKGTSNDIVIIDPVSGEETELVATMADERDPCWNCDGDGFFYSSDRTGIFNIYYRDLNTGEDLMVTNVFGGAFSPDLLGDNLIFSSYGDEGYEIRNISGWKDGVVNTADVPDDEDLMAMRGQYLCRENDADEYGADYDYSELDRKITDAEDYDIDYTPVYLFPRVIYYDDKLRLGLALDSRDYLDRQAVFATATINADKEFNFQLGIETRQFKPTFSLNFYAARKYHKYFEESMGDVQVRYDLWDVLFACILEIDKPSRRNRKDITLQYNHGEYGLNINAWDVVDSEMGWNYYKANEFSIILNYVNIGSGVNSDINPPSGRRLKLEITRAWDKMSSGVFEYNFKPIYDRNEFGRYRLMYEEYIPLPLWTHTLTLFARGGALDESKVDDFFDLFIGSRDGMRGYSYYSMGGRKNAMLRVTYRFPVWTNIDRQVMGTYFSSIFAGIFAEAGQAWDEDKFMLDGYKRDAGFELRLKGFSFYNYPLAASFEAAYGLDEIEYSDPFRQKWTLTEGKEWKFYGSVFFDF